MVKHSPSIELANARAAFRHAEQECPHWDLEGHDDVRADCCYALDEARERLRAARRQIRRRDRSD